MVKSDEHMARVKAQLMHEQGEIEGAQERFIPHLKFRQPPVNVGCTAVQLRLCRPRPKMAA